MLLNGHLQIPCIGIGKNSLAHYGLACSRRSAQWIVDSGQWREIEKGGKQTWKRVRGRARERGKEEEKRFFRALSLNPPLRHFFGSFFFPFSQLSQGLLQVNYVNSFISKLLWYIVNLSVEHFWRFVIDSAGKDLVVLTFQLLLDCETVILFFSFWFSFFYFSLLVSIVFFKSIFRFSPQSLSLFSPAPCSIQEGTTICFPPEHSFDYLRFLGLRKKYGLFCGLKEIALIDVLVSWKLQL